MSRRRAAFLLLEVVLALSIFVVAVVGTIASLNAGIDADYQQRRFTAMRLNLQSLLAEAKAGPLTEGRTEFPPDLYQVAYTRQIAREEVRLSDGKKLGGLWKITVIATDARKDNRVMGELWTYALR